MLSKGEGVSPLINRVTHVRTCTCMCISNQCTCSYVSHSVTDSDDAYVVTPMAVWQAEGEYSGCGVDHTHRHGISSMCAISPTNPNESALHSMRHDFSRNGGKPITPSLRVGLGVGKCPVSQSLPRM